MKHLKDASEALTSKLISTLNHSIQLKKDGVDPMIPFAFVYHGTNATIKTFVGDSSEYADKMFERTIVEENPDYAIYGFDGYLTLEGKKHDAIILKAYDKTDDTIYVVGQRFLPKSDNEECTILGNPAFIDARPNDFIKEVINQENTEKENISKNKTWWQFWK